MELDVVVKLVVVPVSTAHLQATFSRLNIRELSAVADDVGEAMTT